MVSETKKPLTDVEERNLVVSKKFCEITYWNWDCFPVNDDSINQSMDWLILSKMVNQLFKKNLFASSFIYYFLDS